MSVLNDRYERDHDREQNSERDRDFDRHDEGQERNGDEGLAEPERRAHEGPTKQIKTTIAVATRARYPVRSPKAARTHPRTAARASPTGNTTIASKGSS